MYELTEQEIVDVNGGVLPVLIVGVSLLETGATLSAIAIAAHKLYEWI